MITNCQECRNKQKQFQILRADLEFQIKKMREDLAEEKVMLQLDYQKQLKKNIEKYQKQKHERQQQNKKWIAKYDNMINSYQAQLVKTQQKYDTEISNSKKELINEFENRQLQKLIKHKKQLQNITKNHKDQITSVKQKQDFELNLIKRKNEKNINDLNESHIQKVNEVTCEHQLKVNKLKKGIEQVITEKQKLKKEAHLKQTSLYQQIYERKKEISSLKYQIDHLNTTIKNCEEEIRFKNLQIQNLKEQHQKSIQNIKSQYLTEKSAIIQDYKHQIGELLMKKLEDCQQFQQNVKEIQVKRQNQLKIYQTYIQEVKDLVEERPSRNEDVQQINILKDLLNKKQKQFQKVADQAKNYKLQLDYKQQTFNRIFKNNANPLNIEKIGKKKELKINRGSSIYRQNTTKYNSISTMHVINTTGFDFKRQKSIQPKSSKLF